MERNNELMSAAMHCMMGDLDCNSCPYENDAKKCLNRGIELMEYVDTLLKENAELRCCLEGAEKANALLRTIDEKNGRIREILDKRTHDAQRIIDLLKDKAAGKEKIIKELELDLENVRGDLKQVLDIAGEKHSEWKKSEDDNYECGNCGQGFPKFLVDPDFKYCPKCGSRNSDD